MILIVCVDDSMGMMFSGRRQSQDRILRERILMMSSGKKLWMNMYSAGQFEQVYAPRINIDEEFLNNALPGEYCFVENAYFLLYADKIEKIVLYRWNRKYL